MKERKKNNFIVINSNMDNGIFDNNVSFVAAGIAVRETLCSALFTFCCCVKPKESKNAFIYVCVDNITTKI